MAARGICLSRVPFLSGDASVPCEVPHIDADEALEDTSASNCLRNIPALNR